MLALIFAALVTIFILYIIKDHLKDLNNLKHFLFTTFVFTITTFFIYLMAINIPFVKDFLLQNNSNIYDKIAIFLLCMSISILLDRLARPIIPQLYETNIINKYEQEYSFKKYEYYRDILYSESPAILAYCYNKKLNIEDITVAILLHLQMKKVITIEQNKIKLTGNINNLHKHEKYLILNIQKIFLDNKSFKKIFKTELISDLRETQYIKMLTKKDVNILGFIEYFLFWMFVYLMITFKIFFTLSNIPMVTFLAFLIISTIVPVCNLINKKINPVIRTEKTLQLCGKLLGLKNYINDFSNIKNNSTENINLYDEYVIYAIIFNLKGKLNNECKKIYEKTKTTLHYIEQKHI